MSEQRPALSVIIASHNRSGLLHRCLDSLCAQDADPASFEVIVADDGSPDGTAAMVEGFAAPFRLRLLRLDQGGQAAAQNEAIAVAEGSACLFLDDDMIALPGLIAAHIEAQRRDPATLGVGRLAQQPVSGHDPYAHSFARRWNARYAELAERQLDWADCYGGNLSMSRETLRAVGGFATDLPSSEDLELALRLCRAGCRPTFVPTAHAIHDDQKPGRRILADERRFGAFCAWFVERQPSTRRRLLGWFEETTSREVVLRRAFLALRLPPRLLAAAGRLLPGGAREVWFGFVSRYGFWLGVRSAMSRAEWWQATRGVPVLMYHAFTDSETPSRYVMAKRSFARQMRLLAALRYRAISFEQLGELIRERRPLPRRTVVITIDDGYRDNFEIAHPVLRRHDFAATIFLVSQRLGASNDWGDKGPVNGRPTLSLEQIETMRAEGVHFGAHTRTHCRLSEASHAEIETQIGGSREDLTAALGEEVDTFAYPYGLYNERAVRATGGAGFLAACTTWVRPARLGDDPLRIPRIEVEGTDSTLRFLRRIWLGGE